MTKVLMSNQFEILKERFRDKTGVWQVSHESFERPLWSVLKISAARKFELLEHGIVKAIFPYTENLFSIKYQDNW